jgi:hypothetical protein
LANRELGQHTQYRAPPVVRQRRPNRLTGLAHCVIPATEPAPEAPRGRVSALLSSPLNYQRHHVWDIEAIFRTAKSILETRLIFHQADATIVGHLFCSFLALLLRKELDQRLAAAGVSAEWADIVRDLDRVEQITVEQRGKRFVLRPQAPGCAGSVFQAVGVALPPLVRQLPPATPPPSPTPRLPARRGRPRRGATSA